MLKTVLFGILSLLNLLVFSQFNYQASFDQNVAGTYTDLGSTGTAITTNVLNLANDAKIAGVYTLGQLPLTYGSPHTIMAAVVNNGATTLTDLPVSLSVTGANSFTNTKLVSLAPQTSSIISFDAFSPSAQGNNVVTVSVPADDTAANNSASFGQVVGTNTYSFADGSSVSDKIGFGNTAGLMLVKYTVTGSATVTSVNVHLDTAANAGNTVYAIVMDAAGNIVGQSSNYVITAGDSNSYKNFVINTPPVVTNTPFFVGLAQTANASTAYYPVSVQAENPARPGAYYYKAGLSAGLLSESTANGRFMIQAFLNNAVPPQLTTVTSFNPDTGPVGTSVTINGTNFNPVPSNNIVFFGAVKGTVTSSTATSLIVTVPPGVTYKPISVLNNATSLIGYSSKPFITTFINPFGTGIPVNFYRSPVSFPSGTGPRFLTIGDIDGDGKTDLIVSNSNTSSSTISIFKNTSSLGVINSSSFAAKVDFTSNLGPREIAFGDIDGDGKPDIVVGYFNNNVISVFRNTSSPGAITTSSFAAKVDFNAGMIPRSVVIADVDGDGKPDLVAASTNANALYVFRNTSSPGSINITSFAPAVNFSTGQSPFLVAAADLDADGKPDLVAANGSSNGLSVIRNISTKGSINSSSFSPKVDITSTATAWIVIGDLDRDGKPELTYPNSGVVSILRNISSSGNITTGSFSPPVDLPVLTQQITIGDIDGDGKPDLVIAAANDATDSLSVLRNLSTPGSINTGSFSPKIRFYVGSPSSYVAIADLDGDGLPEIITANETSNKVSILQIRAPYVFTGNGSWDLPANWQYNLVGPKTIPAGETVLINNLPGGQCNLIGNFTIQDGGRLTVNDSKKLNIVN